MAQFSPPAAYLRIADQLDLVGQKYRGLRIARGAILWVTTSAVATAVAAFAAQGVGDGRWTWLLLAGWATVVVGGFLLGVVRPLMIRTPLVKVARMVEATVPGLHNGLTNGVLLAEAGDLRGSPFLPQIFEEIHAAMSAQPVGRVVRMGDLNRTAFRAALALLPVAAVVLLFRPAFGHGWNQLMHPAAFVPQTGAVELISVKPGDVTIVTGQPLEIEAVARCPGTAPDAKLIFDGNTPAATLAPTANDDGTVKYAYRIDRAAATTRYRLDVGGTESAWYTATVVHRIAMTKLTLNVEPPKYTRAAGGPVSVKPDAVESTPVTVPQGSVVQVVMSVDVPVNAAMLQVGDRPPVAMVVGGDKATVAGNVTVLDDTPVSVLVTDGAGQVVATLPDRPLVLHCTRDAAPAVEMHWPTPDCVVPPAAAVRVSATVRDDYGLDGTRVLMGVGSDGPLVPVDVKAYPAGDRTVELSAVLDVKPAARKHGGSIRVQVEATDGRDLAAVFSADGVKDGGDAGGPQTTASPVFEVKFRDPEVAAKEGKDQIDKLREILTAMLKDQRSLNVKTLDWKGGQVTAMEKIGAGQADLKARMTKTAETFAFDESDRQVQKTLQVLALNPATAAVDTATLLAKEKDAARQAELSDTLQSHQRRIAGVLESLLALLNQPPESVEKPTTRPGDQLANKADAFSKLDEALKNYMKEQQRILDQQASLAKKPVDNYTDADKKLALELLQAEDKLDAYMKAATSDFSKLAEQDMANASVAKEAQAIYSETTMAKDALKQQAQEIAVPAEENGLEGAKELAANLERWLSNTPDRQQWTQEDLVQKSDTPLPELPKELQDMVGELLEQQEDLFNDAEDMNANITDSADKGVGWDAADGPIADMSAKGITGNQLPNNNEMGGRAGEGRSGRSQGEFVGDSAVGKGGRNTPTRLDPTPFAQGQVNDTSKDPVGGATGGGKVSGQGAAGLQGPVPPKMVEGMKRLATKQADLRNTAERLNLQYHLDRYDNYKLRQAADLMRQVETDLNGGRYQNAMRKRDVLVDDLDTSRMLVGGEVNVQQDTTPTTGMKLQRDLNDASKGELPPAWSDPLKEYYRKLAAQ